MAWQSPSNSPTKPFNTEQQRRNRNQSQSLNLDKSRDLEYNSANIMMNPISSQATSENKVEGGEKS